jgi:Ca2+-binding RTX toxin-like protein
MCRRRAFVVSAASLCALAASAPGLAAVTSRYEPLGASFPQGTLFVASDAADAIAVTCYAGFVVVNGAAPQTGQLACSALNRLNVTGGPGDNRIDVAGITLFPIYPGASRGITSSATIDGGAGDDVIRGPTRAIVRITGGPGSDRLEGNAIDRYVFGAAQSPELDTIVERATPWCVPSFADTNQLNLTIWTVAWDALDFGGLAADDGVVVDGTAPAGLLAQHRNRTVRLAGAGGVALEAIAGGDGGDVIAGGCMVVGNGGDDRLSGTAARGDLVLGGPGADALAGAGSDDVLAGGADGDTLDGGAGADSLFGGPGDDELVGGAGGDAYLFDWSDGAQSDTVAEGRANGVDVLALRFTGPVVAKLAPEGPTLATAERTTVLGRPGTAGNLEGLIGGTSNDRLTGNAGANHFWSGGGLDLVDGRGGDDTYHVNWLASMPSPAYAYWDSAWFGPFEREVIPAYSPWDEGSISTLRVLERPQGGRDAIDLVERFAPEGDREPIDGGLESGVRVDLSAGRWILRSPELRVESARARGGALLEIVRGSWQADTLIGNAANNELEGRQGADHVDGRAGHDTCLVHERADRLRSCERLRDHDPYE